MQDRTHNYCFAMARQTVGNIKRSTCLMISECCVKSEHSGPKQRSPHSPSLSAVQQTHTNSFTQTPCILQMSNRENSWLKHAEKYLHVYFHIVSFSHHNVWLAIDRRQGDSMAPFQILTAAYIDSIFIYIGIIGCLQLAQIKSLIMLLY